MILDLGEAGGFGFYLFFLFIVSIVVFRFSRVCIIEVRLFRVVMWSGFGRKEEGVVSGMFSCFFSFFVRVVRVLNGYFTF